MALTKEQLDFRDSVGYKVEDTFTNLKINYFQPVIEEEKRIIEEYEKSLFGKVGCGGAFSYGCLIPTVVGGILLAIPALSENLYIKTVIHALIVTLAEYFVIVWYNNSEFYDHHKSTSPFNIRVIKEFLMPLTGVISQDMKDDSKITLITNLSDIREGKNKLSNAQIADKGIMMKRGLSVYESDIMDLAATMADGTRINYSLHQVLNEVYISKKHGSKHKQKGKITLKGVFTVPTKVYSVLPEGEINIGNYVATVMNGEKNQKIVIKEVLEETDFDGIFLTEKAIDMMTTVFSELN